MTWAKAKMVAAMVLTAGAFGVGGGVAADKAMAAESPAQKQPVVQPNSVGTDEAKTNMVILRTARKWGNQPGDGGTIWRYFETWQTDVVRQDNAGFQGIAPQCADFWQLPKDVALPTNAFWTCQSDYYMGRALNNRYMSFGAIDGALQALLGSGKEGPV